MGDHLLPDMPTSGRPSAHSQRERQDQVLLSHGWRQARCSAYTVVAPTQTLLTILTVKVHDSEVYRLPHPKFLSASLVWEIHRDRQKELLGFREFGAEKLL